MLEPIPFAGYVEIDESFDRTASHMAGEYVSYNEPVAWRTHYPSGWEYKDGNPPFELKGNSQLLYTHPVKELTQNITRVWRLSDQSIQIVFTSCRSASEFEAILRKASEK